jgi:hypothetical protein
MSRNLLPIERVLNHLSRLIVESNNIYTCDRYANGTSCISEMQFHYAHMNSMAYCMSLFWELINIQQHLVPISFSEYTHLGRICDI